MPPPPPDSRHPVSPAIAEQAALWLARRDRGLTADEQDAYLQWLAADPRHAAAMSQHAAALERLMALYDWQPGQSAEPNPDLFAPPRRRARRWPLAFAAAAALAICATVWWLQAPSSSSRQALAPSAYLRVNERHALPDGSIVELKDGARLATDFSPAQRRVRLTGEGHFTVARDESRPFVVEAAGVTVRALGTAFNVRVDPHAVEVLVTHGSVRVMPPSTPDTPASASGSEEPAAPVVSARQRAVVNLATNASAQVADVTGPEIADTLAWQAPRFQFLETPLAVAVAEFNRLNRTQIILGAEELRALRIGGTFRVDNVEGFVRLLEATLDLRATPRGPHEFVLTQAK